MQILLLEIIAYPKQYSCLRKEGGKTQQEAFFHKSALFNQKYHCSWLVLKANVMASHNAGCRNRLVSLVDTVTQPDLDTAKSRKSGLVVSWEILFERLFSDVPVYFFGRNLPSCSTE